MKDELNIDVKYNNNFVYYIVMNGEGSTRGTIFNQIDFKIIDSAEIISLISHLPATIFEFINEWPQCFGSVVCSDKNNKYEIIYIYDCDIDDIKTELDKTYFGCIFLLKNLKQENVDKIISYSKMPIVALDNNSINNKILSISKDTINNLFDFWNNIIHKNQIEKTSFKGIKIQAAKFLDPMNMVTDRLRGKYVSSGEELYQVAYCTPATFNKKEKEANLLIKKSLKRILAEKVLVELLTFLSLADTSDKDFANYTKKLKISIDELREILDKKSWDLYNQLVIKILDSFKQIEYKTDFILAIPSMNFHVINELNKSFEENHKIKDKLVKAIVDQDTYYEVIDTEGFSELIMFKADRAAEITLLSLMYVFYSLARRLPFVRTRNVPTRQLYNQFIDLKKHLSRGVDSYAYFNSTLLSISKTITSSLDKDIWKIISNNSKHLKVLSDLPVEWIKINEVPLCLTNSMSRIPISPANGMIVHSYKNREVVLKKDEIKVLVVNSLMSTEISYGYGKGLYNFISDTLGTYIKNVEYVEPIDKDHFMKSIDKSCPDILVYFGHGQYNDELDLGELRINETYLNSMEIKNSNLKMPPIIILGACETEVMWGSSLDIANIFINSGAVSVIGSYFEIETVYTWNFIAQIFYNIKQYYTNSDVKRLYFNDILLDVYRKFYILDSYINLKYYLQNNKINQDDFEDNFSNDFYTYCENNKIYGNEKYKKRDKIVLQILKNKGQEYLQAYSKLVNEKKILNQSLFYSSLGSPENIKLEK